MVATMDYAISIESLDQSIRGIRVGIGHPGHKSKVHGYVLSKAPTEQLQEIDKAIDHTLKFMTDIVQGEWDNAMNALHQR